MNAYSEKGALVQFLSFLKNFTNEDGSTPHPSRLSKFSTQGVYTAHGKSGVQMGSLDDLVKLDSINENNVNTGAAVASAHSDHLHEQALSARLASMEQSGAFGPGISIPSKGNKVSPTHGGSLRVGMVNTVGSLEHARKVGGSHALSPMGNHWDRMSSTDSEVRSAIHGSKSFRLAPASRSARRRQLRCMMVCDDGVVLLVGCGREAIATRAENMTPRPGGRMTRG